MSAKAYACACAREERGAIALPRGMGRSMRIAGATAYVSVMSLNAGGEPRFETTWSPAPPERFSPADFALFDAFRRRAMADIRAELGAEQP